MGRSILDSTAFYIVLALVALWCLGLALHAAGAAAAADASADAAPRVGADVPDAPAVAATNAAPVTPPSPRACGASGRRGAGGEAAVAVAVEPTTAAALFAATAIKALRGDFGPLRPWQRHAYQRGLQYGVRTDRVRLTVYGPWEGYDRGEGCAYGYGCSESVAASNHLPGRTVIWVPRPAHLRVIGATGAPWDDEKASREGCAYWIDLWIPKRGWKGLQNTVYHRDIAVIPPPRKP